MVCETLQANTTLDDLDMRSEKKNFGKRETKRKMSECQGMEMKE